MAEKVIANQHFVQARYPAHSECNRLCQPAIMPVFEQKKQRQQGKAATGVCGRVAVLNGGQLENGVTCGNAP